ncbi:MAG TPA: (2Fe-2S)-binding protein [Piscirickettsiaceae bacterium]|nr:(2Fe-2S)-binding protein [Piscirickettsiaceae bacterium]
MIELDRLICHCNDKSVTDIVDFIKKNSIKSIEELTKQKEMPLGDKCKSCIKEGYENDGYSLLMILSLIKKGKL